MPKGEKRDGKGFGGAGTRPMIGGAIFDVDGVLLDSMPVWETAAARYLQSVGREPEPGLRDILFPLDMGTGARYLKEHYRLPAAPADIERDVLAVVAEAYHHTVPLKPGAARLLDWLRSAGVPMAVATAGNAALADSALRRLGVREHFAALLSCGQVGAGKHEPRIYLEAARRLGTAPGQTVVLEDTLTAALTARQAGFAVAGVYDASSAQNAAALRAACRWYLTRLDEDWFLRALAAAQGRP